MGREVAPGLSPQAEPLLFQIPPRIIQERDNNQDSQQGQKNPPLCCLPILVAPQEFL